MIDSEGWVYCPACSRKTRLKVNKDTQAQRLPLYCHRCLRTTVVDIKNMVVKKSQTH